jgi:CubicO group peptidase (beta-lactamase class C family)
MPERSVDLGVFLAAVHRRMSGLAVGYSGCVGTAVAGGTPPPIFGGYARTSADGTALPVTPLTPFGIASCSKFLTALAAVQLLDGGSNALGADLDSYMYLALPNGWNVSDPAVQAIRYRHLLTHTSGVAGEGSPGEPASDYASLQRYFTQPNVPLGPLGNYDYSNVGFALFRLLLPTLAGMAGDESPATFATAYENLVVQRVFAPVGVTGPATGTPPGDDGYVFSYAYPGTTSGYDWSQYVPSLPLVAGAATWWVSIAELVPVLDSLNRVDGRILSATQWQHMQGLDLGPNVLSYFANFGLGIDWLTDNTQPGATNNRYIQKNGGLTASGTQLEASIAFFGAEQPGTGSNGPYYAALFANSDLSAPLPDIVNDWAYCTQCGALFCDASGPSGVCPAGGKHTPGGAAPYLLSIVAQNAGQSGWAGCSKCQMLCYEPAPQGHPSVCAAGGGRHNCQGPAFILTQAAATLEVQDGWKWCRKCGVLAYSVNGNSVCAAGNGHDFTQSGDYTLQWVTDCTHVLLEAYREAIQPQGGVGFFPQGTRVAAVDTAAGIQLYALGQNGNVYAAVIDPNGSWQGWNPVLNGTFTRGTPVTAVTDGAGTLHLFAVGQDGNVYTPVPQGGGEVWNSIGSNAFTQTTPVTAVCDRQGAVHLFAVSEVINPFDNPVHSPALPGNVDTTVLTGGSQQEWNAVLNGTFTQGTPVSAVCDLAGAIHLSAVGQDGQAYTTFPSGGSWQQWTAVPNGTFTQGTPVTAVWNLAAAIYLFAVGQDGFVYTTSSTGGSWQGWKAIPNGTFDQGTTVAAVSDGPSAIHLFALGQDGQVYTNVSTGGSWQGWKAIPNGTFSQGTPVTAIAIGANNDIHLFAVGELPGNVYTAVFNGSSWQGWLPVGP